MTNIPKDKNKKERGTELGYLKKENEKLEGQLTNMFNLIAMMSELTLSLELDEVYSNILDLLVVAIGSRRHSIALIDSAGVLKVVASKFGDDEVDFEYAILQKGAVKQVLKTKEVFIIEDLHGNRDDVVVCIPLKVKNRITGIILIHEMLSHKKVITEEDRKLFNLISLHAGYSLLAAQMHEKSKKEVAVKDKEITMLYDISSLVSSAIDINEVLNIIMDAIADLLVCDTIAIMLYDEDEGNLLLRTSMGLDPGLLNTYCLKIGEGISGKVFKEKKPVLIKNVKHEVRYVDILKTGEAKLYSGSILSVPIIIKNKVIGVITVSKCKGGKLLDVPEKKLITTLAAQAAIGIDNAYLYERQGKELVKVSSLFIATNQLHSTVDLDEIYKIANELLVDFIGAKTFCIMLKDRSEKELNIVLSRGIHQDIVDNTRISVGEGMIGQIVEEGESFILSRDQSPPVVRFWNRDYKLFACVPLRLESEVIGAIVINELLSQKRAFVKFDRELFDLMAQHTAAAILRSQLFAKSEQKSSSVYDLSWLLTIEYKLKRSLNVTLELVHNSIRDVKSAVLIYEEPDRSTYRVLAYRGYKEKDLKNIDFNHEQEGVISIPLYYDKKEAGVLRIEKNAGDPLTEKERNALNITGNIISQFIYHDKNFKISKNLAIMLNKEKAQSRAIVKSVADGLLVADTQNKIILVNSTVEQLFHFKEKDAIGADLEKYIPDKKIQKIFHKTFINGHGEVKVEMKVKNRTAAFDIRTSLVKDEKEKPIGAVIIMHDITKELEADRLKDEFLKKLQKISITDALTNIHNRRNFDIRLSEEFTRSKRYGTTFSLIMMDIDHFKMINDTYGHEAGDMVLKHVANIIKNGIRHDVDLVARYGGDEFVLILPETDSERTLIVAERLRKKIKKEPFLLNDKKLNVTVSFGISFYPCAGISSPDDMVRFADIALYKAKEKGRDRTEIYS